MLLEIVLDALVNRQHHAVTVLRCAVFDIVVRQIRALGIGRLDHASGHALQDIVVLQFDAVQTVSVVVGKSEQLGGKLSVAVIALAVLGRVDAGQTGLGDLLQQLGRRVHIDLTLDAGIRHFLLHALEGGRLVDIQILRQNLRDLGLVLEQSLLLFFLRRTARLSLCVVFLSHALGAVFPDDRRVHADLLRGRTRHQFCHIAVVNRSSLRGDDQILGLVLIGFSLIERRVDHLQIKQSSRHQNKARHHNQEDQKTNAHSHLSIGSLLCHRILLTMPDVPHLPTNTVYCRSRSFIHPDPSARKIRHPAVNHLIIA